MLPTESDTNTAFKVQREDRLCDDLCPVDAHDILLSDNEATVSFTRKCVSVTVTVLPTESDTDTAFKVQREEQLGDDILVSDNEAVSSTNAYF